MGSRQWPLLPGTRRTLDRLEGAVDAFAERVPGPVLTGHAGQEWFQFSREHRSASVVMILKAVRIVSGLNAAMRLGEHGYTQELAVLLRTVDDFLAEIQFLLASHPDETGKHQQERFVDEFFATPRPPPEELRKLKGEVPRVSKKKIRAGEARNIDPADPHTIRQLALSIDSVLSGYVHGAYPAIMEAYNGIKRRFRMRGMLGTEHIDTYQRQHSFYVLRTALIFTQLADHLGLAEVRDALSRVAKDYETSDEYNRR